MVDEAQDDETKVSFILEEGGRDFAITRDEIADEAARSGFVS